jgi:hypothetical protein
MSVTRHLVKNTASETAPPFAVAEVVRAVPVTVATASGTEAAESLLEVRKPTGEGRIVVIGPAGIAAGRSGVAYTGRPFVRFAGSDPAAGDSLRAKSGQWEAESDGAGASVTVDGDVRTKGESPSTYKIVRVETATPSGPATPGASFERVRVYDDLQGPHVAVRCLKATLSGQAFVVNTAAAFVDAYPVGDKPLTLNDSGCCGGQGVLQGLRILPVLGVNRITDDNDDAVAVSMTGADPNGTVVLKIYGSGATITTGVGGVPAVVVSANGQATVAGIDVTGHGRGVLRFEAQAFNLASESYPKTTIGVTYAKGDNTTELGWFTGMPASPDLVAASDTGVSDTDNVTADDTPTVSLTMGNIQGISNGTGPEAWVYLDGVLFDDTGDVTDFNTSNPIQRTLATIAAGPHTLQFGQRLYDAAASGFTEWLSPLSDALYLTINPDADATQDEPRVWRAGTISQMDGRTTLFWISDCAGGDLTEDEINKLDNTVTATALADGAFTTSTDPIPLDGFAIVSDPASVNPTPPTSVPQPVTPVGGADNSVLNLRYEGAAWVLVSVEAPA